MEIMLIMVFIYRPIILILVAGKLTQQSLIWMGSVEIADIDELRVQSSTPFPKQNDCKTHELSELRCFVLEIELPAFVNVITREV